MEGVFVLLMCYVSQKCGLKKGKASYRMHDLIVTSNDEFYAPFIINNSAQSQIDCCLIIQEPIVQNRM